MKTLETTCVADIMSAEVLTVSEHWSLKMLIDFFNKHQISGAPVTGNGGELKGVVSLTDLLRFDGQSDHSIDENPMTHYYYGGLEGVTAEQLGLVGGDLHAQHLTCEIMTPHLITVDAGASLQETASLMCNHRIHRIFVTRDDIPVGVVSTLDILTHLAQPEG